MQAKSGRLSCMTKLSAKKSAHKIELILKLSLRSGCLLHSTVTSASIWQTGLISFMYPQALCGYVLHYIQVCFINRPLQLLQKMD